MQPLSQKHVRSRADPIQAIDRSPLRLGEFLGRSGRSRHPWRCSGSSSGRSSRWSARRAANRRADDLQRRLVALEGRAGIAAADGRRRRPSPRAVPYAEAFGPAAGRRLPQRLSRQPPMRRLQKTAHAEPSPPGTARPKPTERRKPFPLSRLRPSAPPERLARIAGVEDRRALDGAGRRAGAGARRDLPRPLFDRGRACSARTRGSRPASCSPQSSSPAANGCGGATARSTCPSSPRPTCRRS